MFNPYIWFRLKAGAVMFTSQALVLNIYDVTFAVCSIVVFNSFAVNVTLEFTNVPFAVTFTIVSIV